MSLARARSARRIKSSNTCGAESSWSRFGWVKSVVIAGLACRFDRLSRHASRAQEQTHDGIQRVYSGSYLGSPYIYVVQAFVLFVPQPNKAASPAGENPAMVNDDEPSSHNRLGSVGDPAQASSVVKVLTGAGQARLQAAP